MAGAGDTNGVVINNDVLRNEDDIGVGSEMTLKVNGRDSQWVVVGIVRSSFPQPALYINYDYFGRVSNAVGMGQIVMVRTAAETDQAAVGQRIQEHFQDVGLRVELMQTVAQLRGVISTIFNIVILFLLFMAVLLGAVGGLGLMGTMSINVIERSREIGVMRAIGASDAAVLRIILLEGGIIGLLSWVIGGLIAIPASRALSKQVGLLLLNAEPNYIFSIPGTILWLVIVILLSVVASYLPARSASRVTVREVLSYE
ncbi:MAG: FtsX-like permease family protein [Chloroflexi bacterium]|nr:FtsX-like permease family protein [Chloroflexota bacterium]